MTDANNINNKSETMRYISCKLNNSDVNKGNIKSIKYIEQIKDCF